LKQIFNDFLVQM